MTDGFADSVVCRVEIPKGSRNKYEWDQELRAIKLDRFLFSSVVYPTDYGFVPDTLAEDWEPLDAIICVSEPTFPGVVVEVGVVAVFRTIDEGVRDDKLLCVPVDDPGWNWIRRLEDVPQQLRTEIAHFFSIYKEPEGHTVEVEGWQSREAALEILGESRERFAKRVV